jgi:hypothetical protein
LQHNLPIHRAALKVLFQPIWPGDVDVVPAFYFGNPKCARGSLLDKNLPPAAICRHHFLLPWSICISVP